MRRILFLVVSLALIFVGAWVYAERGRDAAPQIRTARITRGPVVSLVEGTGTLGAVTTVTVGTQVSGVVSWLGADFNSTVKKGQVIARLDPSLLDAQVSQARASLTKATADLQQQDVDLADRRIKYERAQKLAGQGLISTSDLEAAKLAVEVAESNRHSSQASLVQAQAALGQAQVNLSHATITAPIDGVVLQRSVDVGQTVAASLSSPTIFLIAADLAKMQVTAHIDESDISKVVAGQRVSVQVEAYPSEVFAGVVSEIRLQPEVVSNVTTYDTMIDVPNPGLKLKPGMTATVKIETARRENVLRLPNTALRFRPTSETFAMLGQPAPDARTASSRMPSADKVWLRKDGSLQPVPVTLGLSDGTYTELTGSSLSSGDEVVTSITRSGGETTRTAPTGTNPLIPASPFGGRGR